MFSGVLNRYAIEDEAVRFCSLGAEASDAN